MHAFRAAGLEASRDEIRRSPMLQVQEQATTLCDGITRREWLRVGGVGMLGLTLPRLLECARAG